MKIKKGDWFRCIKTTDRGIFKEGEYCQTVDDGRISVDGDDMYSGKTFIGCAGNHFQKLYTIQDLKDGKVAVENDGTVEDLNKVLISAFPDDVGSNGLNLIYERVKEGECGGRADSSLPTQSVKDFLAQLSKEDKTWPTQKTKDKLDKIAADANAINPKHYAFNIKGTQCDVFDIANAMGLNIEQSTALRYFRKKENQIEDTKKAIKCLQRLVERLERDRN
jgi:hypothetical protein